MIEIGGRSLNGLVRPLNHRCGRGVDVAFRGGRGDLPNQHLDKPHIDDENATSLDRTFKNSSKAPIVVGH